MSHASTAGLTLRPGRPEDYTPFARLFRELRLHEPPPPPEVWEKELLPLTWFHDGPGGPLAYVVADALGDLGFVVMLVVDPAAWRQGIGRGVLQTVAARFRQQGCRRWGLNVARSNAAALTLYTSLGMRPLRQAVTLEVSRAQVAALPAAPTGLQMVPVVEADWEPLTAAFRLMPQKLARFARRASHQLWRLSLEDEPEPMRLGMMDLRSGGVLFPFFAATPGHARALLEDAFGRADAEMLRVAVTDDEPLADLLRGAGAQVELETFELQGPLG